MKRETWIRIASPIALILLWEAVVRMRLLDPLFFPAPSSIAGTFVDYVRNGELWSNGSITLQRIVFGFLLGAIPGIAVGLLVGANRWAAAAIDPIVSLLYPIPKLAILPLVLLIFGIGEESKHVLIAIGVFFIMLINTESGVRQIDPIYLDVARAYRIRPSAFTEAWCCPARCPTSLRDSSSASASRSSWQLRPSSPPPRADSATPSGTAGRRSKSKRCTSRSF